VAHFSPRHRCVRFTLPGFDAARGARALTLQQMVDHLAAIVDAASPAAPVTLVLHDWGAIYGYQYAMRHPQRVAGIVGIDIGDTGAGEFLRGLSWQAKAMMAGYQLWLALACKLPAALGDGMTRWMARALRAPSPQAAIRGHMNHPYVAFWGGGFRGALRVKPACPMLFVYGTRKPFLFHAPAWAERIAAQPGSEVHALRAGHWVTVDRPDEFHALVDAWLARRA
jgi:pimeloyl-ACP methyl ester carboxylesterase